MNFKFWLENNEDLQNLRRSLEQQFPQLEDFFVSENDYMIKIDNIRIKKDERNKNIGTTIINQLKNYANKVSKPIVLTPQPDPGKKSALLKFYKNLGFIQNKGKNKDYRLSNTFGPSMYYKPKIIN